jgi:hypothetical protein
MIATQAELTEFHLFAQEKLSAGSEASLQQLLDQWNAAREYERSVAALRQSVAEADAGLGLPLKEAFAEIRSRLGWTA